MEQNIVQNIATVPSFTDWRNYLIDEPFGMEEKPESEDRINRLAVDYATAMEKENGITQKLAGYDTYFKHEVEAASRLIKIGANFARNEMQKEIDALKRGNELFKRQRDEVIEALRKLVFLHDCEQEGISAGKPTPEEWFEAVDNAEQILKRYDK